MPSGIQIFDGATGALRLDAGTRTLKFFGVATIGRDYTGAAASGTISHGLFNAYSGCSPFAFIINGSIDPAGYAAQFSFSGSTLTWSFPLSNGDAFSRPNTSFTYGIY